jgi:ELWxxDGT repeat protein
MESASSPRKKFDSGFQNVDTEAWMYVGNMTHQLLQAVFFLVAGILFAPVPLHAQHVLKDINTLQQGPEVRELATTGEKVFIAGQDRSLWVTDAAATELKRITAIDAEPSRGLESGNALFGIGNKVLIRVKASINNHGYSHLWVSDGTEAGTRPLLQGEVHINASSVEMTQVGKWVYFHVGVSRQSAENPYQIWKTDGSPEGTRKIAEVGDQTSRYPMIAVGNKVLYMHDAVEGRRGTVMALDVATDELVDLFPGESLFSTMLGATDSVAVFSRSHPVYGTEPWVTDGTPQGTHLLDDIVPGMQGSGSTYLGTVQNRIIFRAAYHIWSTSGDSTAPELLLADTYVYQFDPDNPSGATAGGLYYFGADGALWATDGTHQGTRIVLEQPLQDHSGSNPWSFEQFGQTILFQWRDPLFGTELWTSDGTADGTKRLSDLRTGPVGVNRFYLASTDAGVLVAPWPSGPLAPVMFHGGVDGSLRDVRFVFGNQEGPSSDPDDFVDVEGGTLFTAGRAGKGREVWMTDGTPSGTRLFSESEAEDSPSDYQLLGQLDDGILALNAGHLGLLDPESGQFNAGTEAESGPVQIYAHVLGHERALLLARSATSYPEFWLTDGTATGTHQITHFDFYRLNVRAKPLGQIGEHFLFAVEMDNLTTVYSANVQTLEVTQVKAGWHTKARRVTWLHNAGSHVVLASEDGLLESDGTAEGTRMWNFEFEEMIRRIAALGEVTLFSPNGPFIGELWQTDGTEEGTRIVQRMCSTPESCDRTEDMINVGNLVFLTHESGGGLWISDGTAPGTTRAPNAPPLLRDVEIMAYSTDQVLLAVRQRLVDKTTVHSLWSYDIEKETHRQLIEPDIWEETNLDDIREGRIMNGRFVFAASRPDVGRELFFIDLENPLGVGTAKTGPLPGEFRISVPYPNPASSGFQTSIQMPESGQLKVELFDILGRRVDVLEDKWLAAGSHDVKYSTSGMASGVYLLRAQIGDQVVSQRVIVAR